MVKVSLKRNETTKLYEWTVLDDVKNKLEDCLVFDITTPNKNRLRISNFPNHTSRSLKYSKNSILGEIQFNNNLEYTMCLKSFLECNPILSRLIVFHTRYDGNTILPSAIVFHPITKHWMHPDATTSKIMIQIAESIEIDMINHVLEFDRQERIVACLEHLATRETIAKEILSVVDGNKKD